MVLVSYSPDAIPFTVRQLGEVNVRGPYVRTSVNTCVHIGSVRERIITAYTRRQITLAEYFHYNTFLLSVFEGQYYDSRFTLGAIDDPRIRMSPAIWLEEHGDTFHWEDCIGQLEEDLAECEELDNTLWRGLNGEDLHDRIPDENYRPEVTEVVDLTVSDTDEESVLHFDIDWDAFIREDDIETISLFSDIENVDPGWDLREAFEPPTDFGPDGL